MANVLIEFKDFPQHQRLVGRLLIAYGELEFAMMGCLVSALDISPAAATRILFRVRGEKARIEVADAIARPPFIKIDLGDQWGCAIGAARKCVKYRNQYAHCHWQLIDRVLRFIDLDAEAESPPIDDDLTVDYIPLKLDLLQRQNDYFEYALDWFYYLRLEYLKRAGRLTSHDLVVPKSIPAPPRYDQPKKASPSPDKEPGS